MGGGGMEEVMGIVWRINPARVQVSSQLLEQRLRLTDTPDTVLKEASASCTQRRPEPLRAPSNAAFNVRLLRVLGRTRLGSVAVLAGTEKNLFNGRGLNGHEVWDSCSLVGRQGPRVCLTLLHGKHTQ